MPPRHILISWPSETRREYDSAWTGTNVRYEPRLSPASCRLEILFERPPLRRGGKKKIPISALETWKRRKGERKRRTSVESPLPLEQVHGTNEVRCNKRLESGPSHVGTSAKPVLRSLGLIGRCWVPNCRAPPLARRREPQNCLIVRDVTDDRKPSLSKTATVPIVGNELLR